MVEEHKETEEKVSVEEYLEEHYPRKHEVKKISSPVSVYHMTRKRDLDNIKTKGLVPKTWNEILVDVEEIVEYEHGSQRQQDRAEEILEKCPDYVVDDRLIFAFPSLEMTEGGIVAQYLLSRRTRTNKEYAVLELEVKRDYLVGSVEPYKKWVLQDNIDNTLDVAEKYVDSLIPLSQWNNQYEEAEVLINHKIPPSRIGVLEG